ncbi:putative centromere protein [Podospora fimiseda]|uniref:CENP-C homolog n=1 Tax=Podospora fimiseda TaxID=252190 RepID=A0AAN7H0F8_9PEZI|nr:putative centromere protein [Podospora fimiseda]
MPPSRPSMAARRTTQAAEHIYELGVVGRKTGVTIPDSGIRDEHGMEPIENLFSSPKKPDDDEVEEEDEESDDGTGEAPMDLTVPFTAGTNLLNGQASRIPRPPQGSQPSPVKTFLNSPAQRNKLIAKNASAARSSSSEPREADSRQSSSQPTLSQAASKRRLDFIALSKGGPHSLSQPLPKTNGHRLQAVLQEEEEEDSVESFVEESMAMLSANDDELPEQPEPEPVEEPSEDDDDTSMVGDDTMRISLAAQKKAGRPVKEKEAAPAKPKGKPGRKPKQSVEAEEQIEEEEQPEPAAKPAKGKPGRKPAAAKKVVEEVQEPEEEEEPEEVQEPTPKPAGKRGRRPKADKLPTPEPAPAHAPGKGRKRQSLEAPPAPEPQPKRKKTEAAAPKKATPSKKSPAVSAKKATSRSKGKAPAPAAAAAPESAEKPKRGRKRKSSIDPGDVSQVAIVRRPPMPKSRGLMINRKEIPGDSDAMFRTRSGRNSFKPLAYWRNEQVHYENDEAEDTFVGAAARKKNNKFVLPKIKEVVRVDEPEPVYRPKSRKGGAAKKQPRYEDKQQQEDYIPPEAWETNPGTVTGEVVVWQPEYEFAPPAPMDLIDVMDKQIAISGSAIKTTEVVGGEFRYAKMFSEGFISAGVVDLPVGAVKRMKNSRKVFMIFFVHTGRVLATVQATSFRISKGGVFIVPRFNEYTIENDYDVPARLFFAQGQEVTAQQLAEGESTMMIHAQTDGEETEGGEEEGDEEEESSEESVEE